jgi:hypothetical protein
MREYTCNDSFFFWARAGQEEKSLPKLRAAIEYLSALPFKNNIFPLSGGAEGPLLLLNRQPEESSTHPI